MFCSIDQLFSKICSIFNVQDAFVRKSGHHRNIGQKSWEHILRTFILQALCAEHICLKNLLKSYQMRRERRRSSRRTRSASCLRIVKQSEWNLLIPSYSDSWLALIVQTWNTLFYAICWIGKRSNVVDNWVLHVNVPLLEFCQISSRSRVWLELN